MTTLDTLLDQAWRARFTGTPQQRFEAGERYARLQQVAAGDTSRMENALASCELED